MQSYRKQGGGWLRGESHNVEVEGQEKRDKQQHFERMSVSPLWPVHETAQGSGRGGGRKVLSVGNAS